MDRIGVPILSILPILKNIIRIFIFVHFGVFV